MWFCPAFKRPERLARLADAWVRTAEGEPLHIRLWDQDPERETYLSVQWPEEFFFYESSAEWCGTAMAEFFQRNPNAPAYGFIGEDVIPTTPGWPTILKEAADDWFLAYPNDTIQRHYLSTHAMMGGELARTLGWWVPPGFKHHYLDVAWLTIAQNCGLARYCPQVTFYHEHPAAGRIQSDSVYKKADARLKSNERVWQHYQRTQLKADILCVRKALTQTFEQQHLQEAKEWLSI